MLAAVRDRLIDGYNAPVVNALQASVGIDWWELLESQCERFIDLTAEFPRHHGLIFHAPLAGWPTEHTRTADQVLATLIERGAACGAFAPVDSQIAATLLFAAIHATADAVLAGGDRPRWAAGWMTLAHDHLGPHRQAGRKRSPLRDQQVSRRPAHLTGASKPHTDP